MKTNYHTHTPRCHHAVHDERAYVEEALRSGFKILGFADHVPYPYDDGFVSSMRMRPDETAGYVSTLTALKQEYRGELDIHIGFEAEYFPALFDKLLEHLAPFDYEYLILGHHFNTDERTGGYNGVPTDSRDALELYVDECIRALNTGAFSCFAHPDLLKFTGDEGIYRTAVRELCREAKSCGVPLEYNLLGLDTGRHYPQRAFWEEAAVVGNKVILGWDAHQREGLTIPDTEARADATLRELGLTRIETLTLIKPRC